MLTSLLTSEVKLTGAADNSHFVQLETGWTLITTITPARPAQQHSCSNSTWGKLFNLLFCALIFHNLATPCGQRAANIRQDNAGRSGFFIVPTVQKSAASNSRCKTHGQNAANERVNSCVMTTVFLEILAEFLTLKCDVCSMLLLLLLLLIKE